mgnify:CR=1 FL=1
MTDLWVVIDILLILYWLGVSALIIAGTAIRRPPSPGCWS